MSASAAATTIERSSYLPQRQSRLAAFMGQVGVISIVCLALLLPAIHITSDFSAKIEEPLSAFIVLIYGWLLLAGFARPIGFNGMFIVGAFLTASVILSMWYGSQVLGHSLIARDFLEIPKILFLVLCFTIAYEAELSERALDRLLNFLAFSLLLICAYGWTQFFDLGITYGLNQYYAGALHHELGLERYSRVYSTMGNPNVLGEILSWFLILYTMAFLFRVGSQFRNLGAAFLCLTTSVMTGSRYSLLSSLLGFALIAVTATGALRRRATRLLLLVFLLIPLFAWAFVTIEMQHRSILDRFEALRHPMEVDSLEQRLNKVWLEAEFYFQESPILGHGPAKQIFTDVWDDSEYLAVLKRYGIVGFLPYLGLFLFPLVLLSRALGVTRGRAGPMLGEHYPLSLLLTRFGFAMVLMALFMNIGMSTFYSDAIQGTTLLWFGLTVRCAKTITDASTQWTSALRQSHWPGSHIGLRPRIDST